MLGQEAGLGTMSYRHLGEKKQGPPGATMPWARVGNGQLLGASERAGYAQQWGRGAWSGAGGGGQRLGEGGLWIIGCSMKIKELCQRLLFLLASP